MRLTSRGWKTGTVLSVAAVLLVLSAVMLVSGNFALVRAQTPDADEQTYENMDPLLNELATQFAKGEMTAAAAAASAPVSSEESVGVIFQTESGSAEDVREFLLENGASPGPAFDGFLGADVPVSLLADASQQSGVVWMQASTPSRVLGTDSDDEGTAPEDVDIWHASGLKGEGVKIGIVHLGFDGIQELMGTELPERLTVRCYTGYGLYSDDIEDCENGIGGGTVRAARIYDVAPEASYYIVTVGDWVDLYDAVEWMVEEELDVVNSSLAWIYTGPGDGTSPYALSDLNSVDEAIEGGITWVMPGGNEAQNTWFGAFRDEDEDGFHEFSGDDECNRVELESGERYMGLIRWEDKWVGPFDPLEYRDLDLQMVHEETQLTYRRSYRSFAGRTAPLEYFTFFPFREGPYCLRVRLRVGTAPDWVQVQSFLGGDLEHPSLFGSIISPAESNNPGLISVGVTAPGNTDEIWEHSSRGPGPEPWPAGRIKPEIVGGHGDDSEQFESELASGWEAAYIAGFAALVKQRFPDFGPEDIADYLKSHAEDRGDPGPDNTWGYGFARLPAEDAAEPPQPDACIQKIYGDLTIEGTWNDSCLSENRPEDQARPRGGSDYYARFYTIGIGEGKRVSISLSSANDTYLYLMRGVGRDGGIEEYNDDVTSRTNLNSRIVADNLEAGQYTIEATTYHPETGGDFTLTVEITDVDGGEAPSTSGPFIRLSRGADHICALSTDGTISCWGDNAHGQASPPSGEYSAISSSEGGSCALRDDGAAICWGAFSVRPSSEESAEGPFTDISRGSDHACALGVDGEITCWGDDRHGQSSPPSGEFSVISSHERGSCALRDDGALVCWGSVTLP